MKAQVAKTAVGFWQWRVIDGAEILDSGLETYRHGAELMARTAQANHEIPGDWIDVEPWPA